MTDGPELLRIGVGGIVPIRWDAVKAGQDPGTLTGWASIYNVTDQQDDVVAPGALKRSLDRWRASKGQHVIPLTLDHENTAEGVIGSLADAVDSVTGLKATFRFSSTQKAQDARTKAREGHLNGLSIFGPIIRKSMDWFEGRSVRVLREVGLLSVGLTPIPANTGALVLTAKADNPKKPYGDVAYADPGYQEDGVYRYPLDTEAHCRAAWSYINQAGNAAKYSAEQLSAIKGRIKAALRKYGVNVAASLDFDEFADAMRTVLTIPHPVAMKAAADVLLDSYRVKEAEPDGEPAETTAENSNEETGDAAAYALDIAGMSGPGENPPGGDPSDGSLADPLALIDAEKIKSEIEALEAEIEKEGE